MYPETSTISLLLMSLVTCVHVTLSSARWVKVDGRMENADSTWTLWSDRRVPFYLDASYSPQEQRQIKAAMTRITSDLKGCLVFAEVNASNASYKLRITPNKRDSSQPEKRCYAIPGRLSKAVQSGKTEQNLVLARGPDGCFDEGPRSLLKYLVLALGKRNEHQKPKRNDHLQINDQNIQPAMRIAYRKFGEAAAFSACSSYDYCSITHNQPEDHAVNASAPAFDVIKEPFFIPKLSHLSECDCKDLTMMYGCDSSSCAKLDCVAQKMRPPPQGNQMRPGAGSGSSGTGPSSGQLSGSQSSSGSSSSGQSMGQGSGGGPMNIVISLQGGSSGISGSQGGSQPGGGSGGQGMSQGQNSGQGGSGGSGSSSWSGQGGMGSSNGGSVQGGSGSSGSSSGQSGSSQWSTSGTGSSSGGSGAGMGGNAVGGSGGSSQPWTSQRPGSGSSGTVQDSDNFDYEWMSDEGPSEGGVRPDVVGGSSAGSGQSGMGSSSGGSGQSGAGGIGSTSGGSGQGGMGGTGSSSGGSLQGGQSGGQNNEAPQGFIGGSPGQGQGQRPGRDQPPQPSVSASPQSNQVCFSIPSSGGGGAASSTRTVVHSTAYHRAVLRQNGSPRDCAITAMDGPSGSGGSGNGMGGNDGMGGNSGSGSGRPGASFFMGGSPHPMAPNVNIDPWKSVGSPSLAGQTDARSRRAVNADPQFLKWPGNTVPFYLDASYSPFEKEQIKAAFNMVATDLGNCVQFTEVQQNWGGFKVKVTPTGSQPGSGGSGQACFSSPGASKQHIGQGQNEQPMILAKGPNGCMDNTSHSIMKFAAIVLGKRSEHQRPDRDQYISLSSGNIGPEHAPKYAKYTAANASSSCAYDYCSITHNKVDEFSSAPGTPAFTVNQPPYHIPRLGRLSECDCKELSSLYGCPMERCSRNENCAGIPLPPGVSRPVSGGFTSNPFTNPAPIFTNPTPNPFLNPGFPTNPNPNPVPGPITNMPVFTAASVPPVPPGPVTQNPIPPVNTGAPRPFPPGPPSPPSNNGNGGMSSMLNGGVQGQNTFTITLPTVVSSGGGQVKVCYTIPAQAGSITLTVSPGMSIQIMGGGGSGNTPATSDCPEPNNPDNNFTPRPTRPSRPGRPTSPGEEETDSPDGPTKRPTKPGETTSSNGGSSGSTKPGDKPDSSTSSSSDGGQSSGKPGDSTQSTKPGDSTPSTKPGDSTPPTKPGDSTPTTKAGDSTASTKPGDSSDQPGGSSSKPSDSTAKPGDSTTKPGDSTAKPGDSTAKPDETTTKPGDTPPTTKAGDTPPTTKAGDTPPTTKAGETTASTKAGDTPATTKAGDTPPTTKAGETTAPTKAGDTPPTTKAGEETTAPTKAGDTPATTKAGDTAVTKAGDTPPTTKAGETTAATKAGDTPPTTQAGETTAATKAGDTPVTKAGDTPPTTKAGETTAATKAGDTPPTTKAGETTASTKAGDTPATKMAGQPASATKAGDATTIVSLLFGE